jgi:hypothetical protein
MLVPEAVYLIVCPVGHRLVEQLRADFHIRTALGPCHNDWPASNTIMACRSATAAAASVSAAIAVSETFTVTWACSVFFIAAAAAVTAAVAAVNSAAVAVTMTLATALNAVPTAMMG